MLEKIWDLKLCNGQIETSIVFEVFIKYQGNNIVNFKRREAKFWNIFCNLV